MLRRLSIKNLVFSGWSKALFLVLLLAGYVAPITGSWFATRGLEPTLYGQLIGVTMLPIFSTQLIFGPLGSATLRYSQLAKEEFLGYLFYRDLFAVLMIASAIAIIVMTALVELFTLNGGLVVNLHNLFPLIALIAFVSGASHVVQQDMLSRFLRIQYAAALTIESWLKATALIIGITRPDVTLDGLLRYQTIAFAFSLVVSLCINLSTHNRVKTDQPIQKKSTNLPYSYTSKNFIKYALHFSGWGFFTSIYASMDKWFLLLFCSAADLGVYSVAYQYGYTPVAVFSGIVITYLSPKVLSSDLDAPTSRHANRLRISTPGSLIISTLSGIVLLLASVSYIIFFSIFVGAEFRGGVFLVIPLFLSALAFSTAEYLAMKLMRVLNLKRLMSLKISYCVFGSVALLIGSMTAGSSGVAIASATTSIFYLYRIRK